MRAAVAAMLLLPIGWLLMPRHAGWSYPSALAVALLAGVATTGRTVGEVRLLYVGVVPSARKVEYLSIYCAWVGLLSGLGPLIAGQILDLGRGTEARLLGLRLDPYTPLFLISIALLAAAVALLGRVQVSPPQAAIDGQPAPNREVRT
jgi:hypothetical protein